jgi:glycine cleavage system H protein
VNLIVMADVSTVHYKRSRFSSRLPADRLYAPSHYWMLQIEPGLWRIGFTRFATRMLGDMVEFAFKVSPGDPVSVGQEIGTVEGFKALTDIYCAMNGRFAAANPDIERDITLADTDPYNRGWLYSVRGEPDPASTDVHGYVRVLDMTIEKMMEARREPPKC